MIRIRTYTFIISILVLLLPFSAGADSLRIVAQHWPPYVDESLPQKGLATDLVTTAFSRAGYDIQLDIEGWNYALEGIKIGVYDVVANIWYSDERANKLDYSDPYLINDIRLVKRKDNSVQFNSLEDLNGLMVCVVKDYAYPKDFTEAKNFIKIENGALLPAIGELVEGHCDLVIGDLNAINFVLMNFFPSESKSVQILPKSVGLSKLYIAASKVNPKHAKIIKDFNQALQSMQNDGLYQSIIQDHQKQR